ncbi:uncharacterized protein LOC135205041 [Macrobrachium nipponense]|uniref:uncharacterized protein LOC135205041 n=1 Tax=Macrobrachium nipponense TaxID=159736 RepID=UPI0030C8A447
MLQEDILENCMPLVCNATVKKLSSTLFNVLVTYNDADTEKCLNSASYMTAYSSKEYIFSFVEPQTGSSVVFMVSKSQRNEMTASFLTLLHRGDNARFAICCSHVHEDLSYHTYSFDENDYYICPVHPEDSFALECLPNQSPWQMQHIGNNQHLLVIDNAFVSSKLMTWLATLSTSFSATNLNYISTLQVDYLQFLNNLVFVVVNQTLRNPQFQEFVTQLQDADIRCHRSYYFTVCHKPSSRFQALTHQEGYLLFLHDCLITSLEKDKIILLLLNRFFGTGPSDEYLCQDDITAAMVPSVLKRISYYSSGPLNQVISAVEDLKSVTPNLPWVVKHNHIIDANDSERCRMVSNFESISDYLNTEMCIAFPYKGSVVFFSTQELDSYYFQTFPTNRLTTDIYTWGFTKVTEPFSLFPVKYIIEFSNISIQVNILEKNPVQKLVQKNHGTQSLSHKTSAVHMSKLVMHATLNNNSMCLQDLQNHNFFLYSSESTFWLGPVSKGEPLGHPCLASLSDDTVDLLRGNINQNMSTINRFWPTCSYGMMISWNKKTFNVDDWDYLLPLCKIKEVCLIILIAIPVLLILAGNVFATAVIIKSNLHQQDTSFMIYLSHIAADFFLGLFPYCLIIYDSVSLIFGSLTFQDLNPGFWNANFDYLSTHKSLDMSFLTFERHGFPSFCSIVLTISVGVSLFTLVLQGAQCFFLAIQKPLHHHNIKTGLCTSWVTISVLAVLMNWRENGWAFTGVFDPVTKITFNVSRNEVLTSSMNYYLIVSIFATCWILILAAVMFLSIHKSSRYQPRTVPSEGDAVYHEKVQHPVRTFYWLVGIYSVSFTLVLLDSTNDLSTFSPVLHMMCWWGFLLLISVKWAVIAFTSIRVRQEARAYFCIREELSGLADDRFLEQVVDKVPAPTQNPLELNPLDRLEVR